MKKFKMIVGSLWRTLYMQPMAWLVGLPTDKVLHFGVSMVLAQMFFFLSASFLIAFAATALVGVFKEVVIDKLVNKEKVDGEDLAADVLGICAGIVLLEVFGTLIHAHNYIVQLW